MRPIDADALMDDIKRDSKKAIDDGDKVGSFWLGYIAGLVIKQPTIQPEVLACGNGELVATPEPAYEQVEEYCKRRCLHIVTADFFESTKPQRLGHWILYDKRFPWRTWYKCSECGNYLDFSGVNGGRGEVNFCPNCGAKMTISTK